MTLILSTDLIALYLDMTGIVVEIGRNKAVGLSKDSQTNAVAVYVPSSDGIHGNVILND